MRKGLLCTLVVLVTWVMGFADAALLEGQPPPYIPTPQLVVDRMLNLARVTADDYLIDLGAGDGRIVVTAVNRLGARGFGVEIRSELVELGRRNAQQAGIAERARFEMQDALRTDLSAASVLTLYLGPELNEKLMSRILETMRPGARVVSHDFPIGVWQPDAVERFDVPDKNFGRGGESVIMLWVVPGKVQGRWRARVGESAQTRPEEFSLAQQFQQIEGIAHRGRSGLALRGATLAGDRVRFEIPASPEGPALSVDARIDGEAMRGTVRVEAGDRTQTLPFAASRIQARPDIF